ncbi:hypothetical protein KL86SPO_50212 [uncultured Sporomusa sp.]|uniref:Uncharacterized protein n=1 Tax=uncultured Sporomusa sp. TaxID=307249 RepID=A0A212LY38_9FIRM|nr:hypothetical protein KL86SPO_50212 [uncultured Sporomusa sp.]
MIAHCSFTLSKIAPEINDHNLADKAIHIADACREAGFSSTGSKY